MIIRSVVLTDTNSWTVPVGVSAAWINGCAPGGAGQSHSTDGASGGSGAGAGEFCLGMPVVLTPGTILSLVSGTPGQGGNNTVSSHGETSATFLSFDLLPGQSVVNANGVDFSGTGGGPSGGVAILTPSGAGNAGTVESPTAYGGASGGTGEGLSVSGGGSGGQQIGQYTAPFTPNIGGGHPGGGGGCGVFGAGGTGANGFTSPTIPGQAGTGYGSGSSGMAGNQTTQTTANGQGGILMIFYVL